MGRRDSRFDLPGRPGGGLVPWIPALVGLGLLAGLLVFILIGRPASPAGTVEVAEPAAGSPRPHAVTTRPYAGRSPDSAPPVPASPALASPRRTASRKPHAASPQPSTSRPPVAAQPTQTDPPPAPATGSYQVISAQQGDFTAEVLISTASPDPRFWSAQVTFGHDVGLLRTYWVESQPRAAMRRTGNSYVFTGTVPVAEPSPAALRMQFVRLGPNIGPISCSVNGVPCAGG